MKSASMAGFKALEDFRVLKKEPVKLAASIDLVFSHRHRD